MLELWGTQSTPILPQLPGPLWPGVVVPDRVLSMGQIELNCVFMLNWISWNWTFLTFKLHTYAKGIVWNRTAYMFKMDLALNNLIWLMCHKTKYQSHLIIFHELKMWIIWMRHFWVRKKQRKITLKRL